MLLALIGLLAACDKQESQSSPSPAPSQALSLMDALPSPTPNQVLPSMPPPVSGAFTAYEDFEHGIQRWTLQTNPNGFGWHLLKASTCGGLYTMVLGFKDNQATRFKPGTALLTLREPIALPAGKHLQLKYDVKGLVNPPEAATIQAEMRLGTGAWRPVAPLAQARFPLVVSFRADLTPYAGQRLSLRFRGQGSQTLEPQKGFYLDDIHIIQAREP